MPAVYTFNHEHSEILNALEEVFSVGRGTMREQWSTHAEIHVEPVGWDALWKLSKRFCKKFDVRYPCIALITVISIDFDELTADVDVLSVQHESVSLPERVTDVPILELFPTVKQREFVSADITAEFIDLMRFFYENIWMPWDDQEDKIIMAKTIEDRMSLWLELHDGSIPNSVARPIIMLRNSAINAHEKLKELDSSFDGGIADEDDSLLPSSYISQYAEMNAIVDSLMPKWTLYENPLVREHYLGLAKLKWQENKSKRNVVALWRGGSIKDFSNVYNFITSKVSGEQNLTVMASAEECLSLDPEEVIICSSGYELPEMPLSTITFSSFINGATIKATEMRSCLLMLSEECKLQDMTLNCALVNTIIVMRSGSLHIKNCNLSDDSDKSQCDFAQGIVAMYDAKVIVEDCTFENFYSGLVVHERAQVELRNCAIRRCGVGIQMYSGSRVKLDGTVISDCAEHSIRCELTGIVDSKTAGMDGLEVASNCKIGGGNLQQEVLIVKQDNNLF